MSFRAPAVKAALDKQLNLATGGGHTVAWLQELFKLLLTYAQIPNEEEALWEYDPNLYLSEATSITANYTPRAACADLVIRGLSEWLRIIPVDAALLYCEQNLAGQNTNWKEPEAILFILSQLLRDIGETSNKLSNETANGLVQQVAKYISDPNMFLRGASHFVAASFFQIVGDGYTESANSAFQAAVHATTADDADLVKITCLKVIQDYLQASSVTISHSMQPQIIAAVSEFVSSHDLRDELEDADDIKACLIETLRDTITINPASALEGPALGLLFTLGSDGAANYQLFQLVTESFENIVSAVATDLGHDAYILLCGKTIPTLSGAFDVANMTQESALTNLAAELVSALAEYGSEPLPDGFVAALMPKLNIVLMNGTEAELVRPATLAVQHMLSKGSAQFLQWTDSTGKSAVEVTLTIINRLLNSPEVDESAATEVGGLATELVLKAGVDKLGSYLMELLRAVAVRLATAERAQFIQSLLMVFAGLTAEAPNEIVDFLSTVEINRQNALGIVLPKWLENSINFAGFDEIRQNVIALSKLYSLEDARIKQIGVKGDLVVDNTGRIKTRSQAKLNPDQYRTIPADLKILKILVEELSSAATNKYQNPADAAAALDSDGSEDGDDWEDVGAGAGGTLDLGSGLTKSQLMAYANEDDNASLNSRVRDDETAEYLAGWFRAEAQKPSFNDMFAALNDEEKAKLQTLV
jgi:importin-9